MHLIFPTWTLLYFKYDRAFREAGLWMAFWTHVLQLLARLTGTKLGEVHLNWLPYLCNQLYGLYDKGEEICFKWYGICSKEVEIQNLPVELFFSVVNWNTITMPLSLHLARTRLWFLCNMWQSQVLISLPPSKGEVTPVMLQCYLRLAAVAQLLVGQALIRISHACCSSHYRSSQDQRYRVREVSPAVWSWTLIYCPTWIVFQVILCILNLYIDHELGFTKPLP